jgi:predicted PurR-regulated permease PerM
VNAAPQHDATSGGGPPAAPTAGLGWWTQHLWQIQPLRDVLVLLSVFGVLWLGYRLSVVTVPILLAMLLAYLVEPVVRWLTRGRLLSRPFVALGLIFGLFLAVVVPVGVGLGVGGVQAASYAQVFSRKVGALLSSVEKPQDALLAARVDAQGPAWAKIRERLAALRVEHDRVVAMDQAQGLDGPAATSPAPDATAAPAPEPDRVAAAMYSAGQHAIEWLREHAREIGGRALSTGAGLGAGVLGVVTGLAGSVTALGFGAFLTAFFFYFFCTGWGKVLSFWQSLIPEKRKGPVIELVEQMDAVIAGFVRGRLVICAVLAVHYTLGYWLIGVPAPLVLGPIIGVLALLPYVAGVGIPVAIGLLLLSPPEDGFRSAIWWAFAGPLIVHGLAQLLDDYLLTPRVQGDKTGMDTPSILFASVAGGILAGFYGLLLAIPVAACLKIVLKSVVWPRFKAWAEGRAKDPLPVAR